MVYQIELFGGVIDEAPTSITVAIYDAGIFTFITGVVDPPLEITATATINIDDVHTFAITQLGSDMNPLPDTKRTGLI